MSIASCQIISFHNLPRLFIDCKCNQFIFFFQVLSTLYCFPIISSCFLLLTNVVYNLQTMTNEMKTLWNIPSRVVARTVGNCKRHCKKFVQNLTICSLWLMEGIDLLCTPQGRVFVHVEQMYAIQIKNLCLKFAKVQFLDH